MSRWIFVIVFGVAFCVSFLIERRRIRNAVYLVGFITSLVITLLTVAYGASPALAAVLLGLLGLLIPASMVVATVLFVAAGITAIKREGLRLPNVLSIAFPLVMWCALIFCIWAILHQEELNPWVNYLSVLMALLGAYIMFTFVALLLYSVLYRVLPKRRDVDFIIVHGAGLMDDGTVTPLLAGRCDKALELFERGGRDALIIASGGQGADEANSEAEAMRSYLVSRGVPEENILLEDKSTTTFENMRNSKAIIDATAAARGIKKPRCVFVTSDYHVLRTATYAMRVHLRADGVGSRTASYFFPNAFIREYVALMMGHPWPTFVLLGMWVLGVFVSESRG